MPAAGGVTPPGGQPAARVPPAGADSGGTRRYATRVYDHAVVCCCFPLRTAVFLAGAAVTTLAIATVFSRTATEDTLRVFLGGYTARSQAVVNIVQVLGVLWGPIGMVGAVQLRTSAVKLFLGYQVARLVAWIWMFNVDVPLIWNCELWGSDVQQAAQLYGWNDAMFEISVDLRCSEERAAFFGCAIPTMLFSIYCAATTQHFLSELEEDPAYLFKASKGAPSGAFYTRSLASRSLAEQMKEDAEAKARKAEAEERLHEERLRAAMGPFGGQDPSLFASAGPSGEGWGFGGSLPVGSKPVGSLPVGSVPLSSAPPPPPPPPMMPPGSMPCGGPGGSLPYSSLPPGGGYGGSGPPGGSGFVPAATSGSGFGTHPYEGLFALGGAPPSLPPLPCSSMPLGSAQFGCSSPLDSPHFGPAPMPVMDDGFHLMGSAPVGSLPLGSMPPGSLPPHLAGSQPLGSFTWSSMPVGLGPTGSSLPQFGGSQPLGPVPTGSLPLGPVPTGSLPLGLPPTGYGGMPGTPPPSLPPGSVPISAASLPPMGFGGLGSLPPTAVPYTAASMPPLTGGSMSMSPSASSLRVRERL